MAERQREAFEAVFRSQYKRLYFFALQLVHDTEASRDIVSEVFTGVWVDFASCNPQTLPAFLLRSVRNRCLDHLRHASVEAAYADYYLHAVEAAYAETPESEERQRRVAQMLALLPETTRHVLEACYLDHRKYREVAEEMGVCQETIKRHVMRALKLLREHYKEKKA